ncbi:MAG: hypothetical protein AUG51_00895 [Acidobacteria bacterium 13_1_20CM_3_53_8]|nr:MAG: hypothetical protein AUG51_00895 [Acidobacteria bacterium 13_1_20CM_3_53_8]
MDTSISRLYPYAFISLFPINILACVISDRILYLQYTFHLGNWESEDRPRGYFWLPPALKGIKIKRRDRRIQAVAQFLYRTPAWVREDKEAQRLVYFLRGLSFTGLFIFFIPILLALLDVLL